MFKLKKRRRPDPLNRIRHAVKDYFTFTKSERRGVISLTVILVLLLIALYSTHFLPHKQTALNHKAIEKEVQLFEASLKPKKNIINHGNAAPPAFTDSLRLLVEMFAFDPNQLPEASWKKLGLDDRIIERIKNYERKGGRFRKKEDLKKIYSLPPGEYERLEPYIEIALADSIPSLPKPFEQKTKSVDRNLMVDINTADEAALMELPLIGAGRAKGIISYRKKIHGYTSITQLQEVWGMPDSVYKLILPNVIVKTNITEQININTSDPAAMRHPYISYQLAKLIVAYRAAHGDYKDISEVKKLPLVDEVLYAKLAPYLTIKVKPRYGFQP